MADRNQEGMDNIHHVVKEERSFSNAYVLDDSTSKNIRDSSGSIREPIDVPPGQVRLAT